MQQNHWLQVIMVALWLMSNVDFLSWVRLSTVWRKNNSGLVQSNEPNVAFQMTAFVPFHCLQL